MKKLPKNIKMNDDIALEAFQALGALEALAELGTIAGCTPATAADVAALAQTVARVLSRGCNYSYRRSRTMQKRVASFPRDARGHFVKRTAPAELPF